MFFVQINGVVARYFEDHTEAKRFKANTKRAMTTLGDHREISLWQKGLQGYPYADAKKL